MVLVPLAYVVVSFNKPVSVEEPVPVRAAGAELASAQADPELDAPPAQFSIDSDRLFDLSYQVDPELVAFADSVGQSPACLIALAKFLRYGGPDTAEFCSDEAEDDLQLTVDPALNTYSEADLRRLDTAESALVQARRAEGERALALYERAVILSGKPGPLVEWMATQNLDGLHWHDGALDIEAAAAGLEWWLTVEQFGLAPETLAETVARYGEVLRGAGVDLDPIRKRAAKRFARLTQARIETVGTTWGAQS